ncbi:MAG: hypothetical protein ACI89X_003026 [Planctomycetota bacterium]|jgi:uncharacterized protein (UPF0276 family)
MSHSRPLVGVALQPEHVFFEHNGELLEQRAELFEITPEALWDSRCEPTPGHERLLQFCKRRAVPVVGHGVLFSIASTDAPPRRDTWLRALQRDATAFGFLWLSEHLGFADADGQHTAWPLPLPVTEETVATVTQALQQLRSACDSVLFENNADLFCLGEPLQQAQLYERICVAADAHMLLDLHNAYAFCRNTGLELERFLDHLPWSRVREIHLSGGSDSDPGFLPSGRSMRLDSHDAAVPEAVWQALQSALPRARNLRAVVCEWFPDAMDAAAGRQFAADFDRAHAMVADAF